MSSHRRPWYPWYPKDFNTDEKVKALSDDAELLYRRVLDVMWQANDLQLPSNCFLLLNQIARGWSKDRFDEAWQQLTFPGFELLKASKCGKFVYSERLQQEAQKIETISKMRSEIGRKAKGKQKPSNCKAKAKQLASHTDTDTDTDNKEHILSGKPDRAHIPFQEIIDHLNKTTGKDFQWQTRAHQRHISARWSEGHRLDDFKCVIEHKASEWSGKTASDGTPMDKYLRPETLFGTKFESYLNEIPFED